VHFHASLMTVPAGRLQFFSLEATDYLERLGMLAARPTPPDPEEFVRLTRALRGAALMAGLSELSQAASGLEQVAKAFREGQYEWTPEHRSRVAGAVARLTGHVERVAEWTAADGEAAAELGRELVAGLSGRVAPPRSTVSDREELPASVRAFIAREGALVAGTLEHAARAVELGPLDQAADLVLHRLQPLRGLAALPRLTPLPELLDAVELTLRAFREQASPPGANDALRRVAAAIARLAREIAEHGAAEPDTPDFVQVAGTLIACFGSDDDVVDIGSLFRTGDAAPIIRIGTRPERSRYDDEAVELVALADRFRQAAGQLGSAPHATGRHLFLFSLLVELGPLARQARAEGTPLSTLLGDVLRVIARGAAAREPEAFAAALHQAADALSRLAASRNPVFVNEELEPIRAALAVLAPPPAIVPIESLAPDEPPAHAPSEYGVVPIESLAPDAPAPGAPEQQVAVTADEATLPLAPFEQTFSTLHRLTHAPGAPATEPVDGDGAVVAVETLLYRGRRALERADEVRLELSDALRAREPFAVLEPLVSELIDLVPLALAE
jgi:hypothetical protein